MTDGPAVPAAAPSFPKVDELFDGEPPPPQVDVRPRVLRLQLLLAGAVALDVAGLLLTVVPGAIVTVWAWLSADAEVARIEAGTYDEKAVAAVVGVRNVARAAMVFCVLCLVGQAWALHNGYYDAVWATLYELTMGVLNRILG
ncbi:MAG: hypothetical protein H6742_17410 [Alphaproteobacteria bacterium]|nr:hypothetical protein [Alphaproteobacteria bacterium]